MMSWMPHLQDHNIFDDSGEKTGRRNRTLDSNNVKKNDK